ncbi:MAG: PorP/SprF family type IX secretion system membrane protein [Bacteroidales bacterium]|nr:PorP/SprF family type IX secretion system membrane protein [Bacteroidales bacterium]
MKKTVYILTIFFALSPLLMLSQDVHFSMFNKAPLLLNPANTGNFDGKWRISTNYRKQGDFVSNPYSTNMVSFDMPVFLFNRLGSFGITALNDRTADRTLNTSEILVTTAHFIRITKNSYLHMGFGFAVVNKSIAQNSLSFPNQFDNSIGVFNPNIENQENFDAYSKWYPDLSWGLMMTYSTSLLKYQFGISMKHYNCPKLEFISPDFRIMPKYQTHFYLEKNFESGFYIKPKLLYTYQTKASEMVFGTDIGIYTKNECFKNFYVGTYFRGGFKRNQDAAIINAGFFYKQFKFNMSYDYSVNAFNKDNFQNSSYEVAIFYIFPRLEVEKRAIQCEIF